MFKKITISFSLFLFLALPIAAQATGLGDLGRNLKKFGADTGYKEESDLAGKIASIVNIILGFLGLLATIIIIYAGFKWLTAAGNDEQVTQAKSTLRNAVIGITVVVLSYVIVNFVVNAVSDSTGDSGSDGGPPSGFDSVNWPEIPNPVPWTSTANGVVLCEYGIQGGSFGYGNCQNTVYKCMMRSWCETIATIPGRCVGGTRTFTSGNEETECNNEGGLMREPSAL